MPDGRYKFDVKDAKQSISDDQSNTKKVDAMRTLQSVIALTHEWLDSANNHSNKIPIVHKQSKIYHMHPGHRISKLKNPMGTGQADFRIPPNKSTQKHKRTKNK